MIQAIVFSRNRAAQLDLLLRSIEKRAPSLFTQIDVLYRAGNDSYRDGYALALCSFPTADWLIERDFEEDVRMLVGDGHEPYVSFLCDDDVIVRDHVDLPSPGSLLSSNKGVLCFSLRLGRNTTTCYPLRQPQTFPTSWEAGDARVFEWTSAEHDFGYPGSLDGHIFRRETLIKMLRETSFRNPNELEERLVDRCLAYQVEAPYMACYSESLLTGVPINQVTETNHGNRTGESYPIEPALLNAAFLGGRRLQLPQATVTAAHTELPLAFA